MLAGFANITIEQGAIFPQLIQWNDEAGNPVDLTGWSAKLQVRASREDTDALISLTSSSGITLGGEAGTIALSIASNVTAALEGFSRAYYDLLMTPPAPATNADIRLLEGYVYLNPRVTR